MATYDPGRKSRTTVAVGKVGGRVVYAPKKAAPKRGVLPSGRTFIISETSPAVQEYFKTGKWTPSAPSPGAAPPPAPSEYYVTDPETGKQMKVSKALYEKIKAEETTKLQKQMTETVIRGGTKPITRITVQPTPPKPPSKFEQLQEKAKQLFIDPEYKTRVEYMQKKLVRPELKGTPGEKIATVHAQYAMGLQLEVAEKPLTTAGVFALGYATPPAMAGIKLGISKVAPGLLKARKAMTAVQWGIGGYYVGSVAWSVAVSPEPIPTALGRQTVRLGAFMAGAKLGKGLAEKIDVYGRKQLTAKTISEGKIETVRDPETGKVLKTTESEKMFKVGAEEYVIESKGVSKLESQPFERGLTKGKGVTEFKITRTVGGKSVTYVGKGKFLETYKPYKYEPGITKGMAEYEFTIPGFKEGKTLFVKAGEVSYTRVISKAEAELIDVTYIKGVRDIRMELVPTGETPFFKESLAKGKVTEIVRGWSIGISKEPVSGLKPRHAPKGKVLLEEVKFEKSTFANIEAGLKGKTAITKVRDMLSLRPTKVGMKARIPKPKTKTLEGLFVSKGFEKVKSFDWLKPKPKVTFRAKPVTVFTTKPGKVPTVGASIADIVGKAFVKYPPSQAVTSYPLIIPVTTTRPKAKIEDISIVIPGAKAITKPITKPSLRISQQPALKPALQPVLKPALQPALKPALQPALRPALQPALQPALKPTQKPPLMPSIMPEIIEERKPTPTPPIMWFPGLKPFGKKRKDKPLPQPKQYIPSLTAAAFRIKAPRKKIRRKGLTGLELRPLPL